MSQRVFAATLYVILEIGEATERGCTVARNAPTDDLRSIPPVEPPPGGLR
jgi:hypothetical protein